MPASNSSGDSKELRAGSTSPPPSLQRRGIGVALSSLLAPFARRFIAGTTLAQALQVAARLKTEGFGTTVDHLGEDVTNKAEARRAAEQYVVILKALKERGLDRNVSVKLSQIGLLIDPEMCAANLARIVAAAEEMGGFVRADMEGSNLTQGILDQVMRAKKNRATPIGVALQAMLKRTPEDEVGLIERGIGIRLCKGAYKEPPVIAHQGMDEVSRQFAALAKRLLTTGLYHGVATHDERLIKAIEAFASTQRIEKNRFEFQMLLGIQRRLARRMAAEGWRVRIYIPFGRAWLPYTLRRLRERKENVWFVVKHLFVR
ncbi:MAG: proline dehydrogenase family protein [bacterium]